MSSSAEGLQTAQATTGIQYTSDSGSVKFTITAGGKAFAAGDKFTFKAREANLRLVAECGAAEMPANKKWKMLLLHSCYSGSYYYRMFNHGTLFFTLEAPYFTDGAPETYVNAIMQGKARSQINDALQALPLISPETFDWWPF